MAQETAGHVVLSMHSGAPSLSGFVEALEFGIRHVNWRKVGQ